MSSESYLKLEECKSGFLYSIEARNFSQGIYYDKLKGFIGLRKKFSEEFLFCELHWNADNQFGTVKPLKEIERCPIGLEKWFENKDLFNWLKEKEN